MNFGQPYFFIKRIPPFNPVDQSGKEIVIVTFLMRMGKQMFQNINKYNQM